MGPARNRDTPAWRAARAVIAGATHRAAAAEFGVSKGVISKYVRRIREEATDRHGEVGACIRCGAIGAISRSVAYGGFLALLYDGSLVCWNGRECSLRLRRRRLATPG